MITSSYGSSDKQTVVPDVQIVIVGAGWAGLATAHALAKHGIDNLTILEARDYIGGRSKTVHLGSNNSTIVELGSAWIQGIKNNPIYDLVRKHSIPHRVVKDTEAVYTWQGTKLSSKKVDQLYQHFWKPFMNYQEERRRRQTLSAKEEEEKDTSLRSIANDFVNMNNLKLKGSDDDNDDINYLWQYQQGLEFILDVEIVQEYGASLSDLSSDFWDQDEELQGKDAFLAFPHGGYSAVVNAYAEPIRNKVQLQSQVISIDYSNSSSDNREGIIVVQYMDPQGNQELILANHVVVTLPLGVLKAGSVEFIPSLPRIKQQAIDSLGSALLNKCILHWENMDPQDIFWPKDAEWIDQISWTPKNQGLWTEFYSPYSLNGQTTLIGFVAGHKAETIENSNYSDEEIVNQTLTVLRQLFETVPDPTHTLVTRWGQDEFSKCSYSYQKVGSTESSRLDLRQEISNTLWFAGEATDWKFPASTHGAFRSGTRVAKKIMMSIQEQQQRQQNMGKDDDFCVGPFCFHSQSNANKWTLLTMILLAVVLVLSLSLVGLVARWTTTRFRNYRRNRSEYMSIP